MTYKQLIKHFGSDQAVADKLGYKVARVVQWRYRGVPAGQQALIELATKGKLKVSK